MPIGLGDYTKSTISEALQGFVIYMQLFKGRNEPSMAIKQTSVTTCTSDNQKLSFLPKFNHQDAVNTRCGNRLCRYVELSVRNAPYRSERRKQSNRHTSRRCIPGADLCHPSTPVRIGR